MARKRWRKLKFFFKLPNFKIKYISLPTFSFCSSFVNCKLFVRNSHFKKISKIFLHTKMSIIKWVNAKKGWHQNAPNQPVRPNIPILVLCNLIKDFCLSVWWHYIFQTMSWEFIFVINFIINMIDHFLVNPCAQHPCKNGATCKTKDTKYKCICKIGFEGEDCSVGKFTLYLKIQSISFHSNDGFKLNFINLLILSIILVYTVRLIFRLREISSDTTNKRLNIATIYRLSFIGIMGTALMSATCSKIRVYFVHEFFYEYYVLR